MVVIMETKYTGSDAFVRDQSVFGVTSAVLSLTFPGYSLIKKRRERNFFFFLTGQSNMFLRAVLYLPVTGVLEITS